MRRLLLLVLVCVGCDGSSKQGLVAGGRMSGGGFVGAGDEDGGAAELGDAQPAQVADVQPAPPPTPDVVAPPPDTSAPDAGAPLPFWIMPWPSAHPPIPDPMAPDRCDNFFRAICEAQMRCATGSFVPDDLAKCIGPLRDQYPALDKCQAVWATGDNFDNCVGALSHAACGDGGVPLVPTDPDHSCAGVLILRP